MAISTSTQFRLIYLPIKRILFAETPYSFAKVSHFANALWVNYDLIESKQIGENQFIAKVKLLNNSTVGDLISALMGNIEFEGVWQDAPSMEDIFIQLTQPAAV